MHQHAGGVPAAGPARVVAGVRVRGARHDQRAARPRRALLVLQTHAAARAVQVERAAVLGPADVGGRGGEELDGAGEGDGAARLDEHARLAVDDGCGGCNEKDAMTAGHHTRPAHRSHLLSNISGNGKCGKGGVATTVIFKYPASAPALCCVVLNSNGELNCVAESAIVLSISQLKNLDGVNLNVMWLLHSILQQYNDWSFSRTNAEEGNI